MALSAGLIAASSAPAASLDLLSAANVRIDGPAASTSTGFSASGAGDVNGDGRDDVIVGSAGADNNSRNNSGSAYVIYGQAANTNIDLSALSAAQGFRIDGAAASDGAGYSADGAGDVNTDGRDDVVIGASNAHNNGRSNSGSSYVIYGQAANTNIDLSALTLTQGFRIDGAVAGDVSGSAVSGAGDINDDGRDDVLVGAYGADNNSRSNSGSAYVIYGQAANTNIDLSGLALTQGFRVDGAAVGNLNGYSVDAAGDVNGDGRDDLISGSFGADNNSRTDSGSAYLIYGQSANANIDLSGFATAQGFRIDGAATGDNNGISVAGSGDFNGDGRDDVITGAQTADNNSRTDSGSAYIVNSSFLPRIAYASPLLASAGAPFSEAPTAFRATPVRTASVSPALPAGLSIDPATGVISGTPTAPGITTHTVTLTDSLGVTSTRIRIGVVNAQGATGATGATGTGTQGLTGAQGPAGIQGPAGPAGRDAQVTCVVKKKGKKVKKVKVTCTVKLTAARNARLHWRLMHAGRSYAHGTSGAQDGNASIRIPGVNRLPAGRYLLRIAGRGGGISLRLN